MQASKIFSIFARLSPCNSSFSRTSAINEIIVDIHTSQGLHQSNLYIISNDENDSAAMKEIQNINNIISPKLKGMDPTKQKFIDDLMVCELDGSKDEYGWAKSKLGSNAILGVSLAVCNAGAAASKIPVHQYISDLAGNNGVTFPVPVFNILNGGVGGVQEFMIIPNGVKSYKESMQIGVEVYEVLKRIIQQNKQRNCKFNLDRDERVIVTNILKNTECLDLITEAISVSGYTNQVKIGMNIEASNFHIGSNQYDFKDNESKKIDVNELFATYENLAKNYPIMSIQNPFVQEDLDSWKKLTSSFGKTAHIVGNGFYESNPVRLKKSIDEKIRNTLLLKLDHIGTISECIDSVKMAKKAG